MKLTDIILESSHREYRGDYEIKRISITYTDFGRFYGIYLFDGPYPKSWVTKLSGHNDGDEFVKKQTGLELPDSYDFNTTPQLDKIVAAFKKKGIEAEYNDVMDVS